MTELHHRAYVGPPNKYDLIGAEQFSCLIENGLRESHTLLDVGCGSLRAGRLLMVYLRPNRYFGLEPNRELVEAGLRHEFGDDLAAIRKPQFDYNDQFDLQGFSRRFDYILAHSILSHASLEQISTIFQQAALALNEEGVMLATFNAGKTDANTRTWVYPGAVIYTPQTLAWMADNAGLKMERLDRNHPSGQVWLRFTKRPEWTPPVSQKNRPNIVLLGVGHSGTTIAVKMLLAMGWQQNDADLAYAETNRFRQINAQFLKGGEFDTEAAESCLAGLRTPWVIKDPRTVLTLEHWKSFLEKYSPTLVWITRETGRLKNSYRQRKLVRDGEPAIYGRTIDELVEIAQQQFDRWNGPKLHLRYEDLAAATALFETNH